MARKIKMKLTEMVDGEAQYVSVVGKGANRQPIKITKSEDSEETSMDLTKFFHNKDALQKAEITPVILAVAAAPGQDLDVLKAALEKADLSTDDIREFRNEDGLQATFFVQKGDVAPGESDDYQTVVQLSDGVSAVCLVATKAFQPFSGSESFDENMQAQGFFPGVHIAQMVLEDTIFEISSKAMTSVEMAEKIKTATEEFAKAVQSMTKALPASVFKLEDIVRKGSTTGSASAGEDPTVGNGDRGEPAGDLLSNEKGSKSSIEPMSQVNKAAEHDAETDEGTGAEDLTAGEEKAKRKDDEAAASAEADAEAGTEEKAKQDAMADLKDLIMGLSTTLNEGLAGVQKQVTDLGARVNAAETVATKAEQATRGRVSATAPEDDGLVTRKQEEGTFIPLMDTAIQSVVD